MLRRFSCFKNELKGVVIHCVFQKYINFIWDIRGVNQYKMEEKKAEASLNTRETSNISETGAQYFKSICQLYICLYSHFTLTKINQSSLCSSVIFSNYCLCHMFS